MWGGGGGYLELAKNVKKVTGVGGGGVGIESSGHPAETPSPPPFDEIS